LGVSSYAAYRLWEKTDVLIGIGSRLEMPYMRWASMMDCVDAQQFPQKLVRIDIDPNEMGRLRPHVGIVADARAGLQKLLELLENRPRPQLPFNRIAEAKAEAKLAISRVQPHIDYLAAIRKVLPRDGILVEELCQAGFTSYFGYPVFEPQTYISPGFQGTLGFGFQTALGVKVAHPKRPVVSITGDGGFMFGVQELATAAQYDIGVVIVLFNNQAFGNVVRDQQTHFGGRLIASELQNPDFLQLAFSFGIQGRRVSSPVDLEIALAKALAMPSPTLIEVKIDRATEQSPWPFIHPRQ